MKNIITVLFVGATLYSCTKPENKASENKVAEPEIKTVGTAEPVVTPTQEVKESSEENKKEIVQELSAFPIQQVIKGYLPLKNALTQDDSKKASDAAKNLFSILKKIDISKTNVKSNSELRDILESASENAEHIGENTDDIGHQREHLLALSNDITDLIEEVGTGGLKLYQDFCPMYNNGKGGTWISETKEIVNPYEGSKMLNCGSVKKVL
ncbi:DUF3347 domain-containing protein [Chryseobacterium jejuense]|uniref:Protein of uncharacterized function (DUF3347) n=1 Tax=Chryseobacterium jejuense TaxID=445960 RepID=A0A2X2XND3_CHRJE|nr:DUF3347 domain-containing protein [Chryseobacterium jejuense]SDI93463.1 Protein of unknown function [Chryseobacterium jejuense]SQB27279.1 Protein of uncharacterised function (DUF3347) [Chryseobacterium jejuense]